MTRVVTMGTEGVDFLEGVRVVTDDLDFDLVRWVASKDPESDIVSDLRKDDWVMWLKHEKRLVRVREEDLLTFTNDNKPSFWYRLIHRKAKVSSLLYWGLIASFWVLFILLQIERTR